MLRREVSPKAVAVAVVVVLAIVQLAYWRLLVYRPPGRPPGPGGGGPMPAGEQSALGLEDAVVDTLAGDQPGYEDGPAWKARFCGPNALALEPDGNLLVTDSRNHRLRRVTPAGVVTTVAVGTADGRPFRYPSGVAVTPAGVAFVSDTGNGRICRVAGGVARPWAGGDGSLPAPAALMVGPGDVVWVLDARDLLVRRVEGGRVTVPQAVPPEVRARLGGGASTGRLAAWGDPRFEPETTEYVPGRRSGAVVAQGVGPVFADLEHGALLLDRPGREPVLLAGRRPASMGGLPSDGGGNRAHFSLPAGLAAAPGGVVYVAEYEGHCIRRVRLPQWLVEGQMVAPGRRRRGGRDGWRGGRGS